MSKPTQDGGPASAEPDWKAIATALLKQCHFVVQNVHNRDMSGVYNRETGEIRHWKEPLMDAVEMYPGMKYDREAVHALSLPKKERDKWFKKRNAAREQKEGER